MHECMHTNHMEERTAARYEELKKKKTQKVCKQSTSSIQPFLPPRSSYSASKVIRKQIKNVKPKLLRRTTTRRTTSTRICESIVKKETCSKLVITDTFASCSYNSTHPNKVAMEVLHHNRAITVNHQCNNKTCLACKQNKHQLVKSTDAVGHVLHAVWVLVLVVVWKISCVQVSRDTVGLQTFKDLTCVPSFFSPNRMSRLSLLSDLLLSLACKGASQSHLSIFFLIIICSHYRFQTILSLVE